MRFFTVQQLMFKISWKFSMHTDRMEMSHSSFFWKKGINRYGSKRSFIKTADRSVLVPGSDEDQTDESLDCSQCTAVGRNYGTTSVCWDCMQKHKAERMKKFERLYPRSVIVRRCGDCRREYADFAVTQPGSGCVYTDCLSGRAEKSLRCLVDWGVM